MGYSIQENRPSLFTENHASNVSQSNRSVALYTFMNELLGAFETIPSGKVSTVEPSALADTIYSDYQEWDKQTGGENTANLKTNIENGINAFQENMDADRQGFDAALQQYLTAGQLQKEGIDYHWHFGVSSGGVTRGDVGGIQSGFGAALKGMQENIPTSIQALLVGISHQVDPLPDTIMSEEQKTEFRNEVSSLSPTEAQVFLQEFASKLGFPPPNLQQISQLPKLIQDHDPLNPVSIDNPGMDQMDPYKSINYSTPISLFPQDKGALTFQPSIPSSENAPLSSWWQILGNATAHSLAITVTPKGTPPSFTPPSMSIDSIEAYYKRYPELFPTYGSNIEHQDKHEQKGENDNHFLENGTLEVGDTVYVLASIPQGNLNPKGNQGIYNIGNTGTGIVFENSEAFQIDRDDPKVNWDGRTLSYQAGSTIDTEIGGASSPLGTNGPMNPLGTLTPTGQNSVVYQQKNGDGSSVTIPIVKNSPYMPVFTENTAPTVNFHCGTIVGVTVYANAGGQWVSEGSTTSGTTPKGQLFRVAVTDANGALEYYSIYTDTPQAFTLKSSTTKIIVPDGQIPPAQQGQYITESDARKLDPQLPTPLNYYSATVKVPEGNVNELVGTMGQGKEVTVVAKISAATVTQLKAGGKDPLAQTFGLGIDQGVRYIPLSSDVGKTAMQNGQATYSTTYTFYSMDFPGASNQAYIGQLYNNYKNMDSPQKPTLQDYENGMPYYQTMNGVERIVALAPTQNKDGTYSATIQYKDSNNYGLCDSNNRPTAAVDWMDQASTDQLNAMVGALTNPTLKPNPIMEINDYAFAQEMQTDSYTAREAQKLLDLASSGKLMLSPEQLSQLQQTEQIFIQAAETKMSDMLESYGWDPKHHLLVSKFGAVDGAGNFYNNLGQDIQFTNGYVIQAAANIRQVDPSFFETPQATTPEVWDIQTKGSIDQPQYRSRLIDALINEVDVRPGNSASGMFTAGSQLDNDTHEFKSHGWNLPTADGQDLESTAEALNFNQGAAQWFSQQATGATDPTLKNSYTADRDYQLNHAIETVRSSQMFRDPAYAGSIYQDPLASAEMQEYGKEIALSNISFVRKKTSATWWGPGKDPALLPLGAACMQGINTLPTAIDPLTAQKVVDTLFPGVFTTTPPTWSELKNSPMFQEQDWADPTKRAGISSIIPTILPMVARYSPNFAKGILDWYQGENQKNSKAYPWHDSGNAATTLNYIEAAEVANGGKDPIPSSMIPTITKALP
ncbi:MAG: hypothetical protein AB7N99_06005 [Simkaniaceae bacterium]